MYQRFFLVFFSLFLLTLSRFILRNNVTGTVDSAARSRCEDHWKLSSVNSLDQPLIHEERCYKK